MTIEIPTPSAEFLVQLEQATIDTNQSEASAFATLRERFAPYAKHNGFIMTGFEQTCYASSNGEGSTVWDHYRENGGKVRGLLCYDGFDEERPHSQNSGTYTGWRLWLTEGGEWLSVRRTGEWSQWQGSTRSWTADVRILTDAQVVYETSGHRHYPLGKIVEQLGKSMAEMADKLPPRMAKLKARDFR